MKLRSSNIDVKHFFIVNIITNRREMKFSTNLKALNFYDNSQSLS